MKSPNATAREMRVGTKTIIMGASIPLGRSMFRTTQARLFTNARLALSSFPIYQRGGQKVGIGKMIRAMQAISSEYTTRRLAGLSSRACIRTLSNEACAEGVQKVGHPVFGWQPLDMDPTAAVSPSG